MSQINLAEKLATFSEHWQPSLVIELRDRSVSLGATAAARRVI